MSTTQWILNCTLLGWVLLRNLGTHPVTRGTYLTPLAVVAVVAAVFLRHLPTAGNDVPLELGGLASGIGLGVLSTALTRIHQTRTGAVIRAGMAFAALWVVVIGGRIAFAEWANGPGGRIAFAELATHAWGPAVARFSMAHQITGADAWRAAFVLMALVMVLTRVVATAFAARQLGTRPVSDAPAPATA